MNEPRIRWTVKRKMEIVMAIFSRSTTVVEASQAHGLFRSEIEGWIEDAKRGMEGALRNDPLEVRAQYEHQLKELYGRAMLDARISSTNCLNDDSDA